MVRVRMVRRVRMRPRGLVEGRVGRQGPQGCY